MITRCEKCGKTYDDAQKFTYCPHVALGGPGPVISEESLRRERETRQDGRDQMVCPVCRALAGAPPLAKAERFCAKHDTPDAAIVEESPAAPSPFPMTVNFQGFEARCNGMEWAQAFSQQFFPADGSVISRHWASREDLIHTMQGWFSNAIERGISEGISRAKFEQHQGYLEGVRDSEAKHGRMLLDELRSLCASVDALRRPDARPDADYLKGCYPAPLDVPRPERVDVFHETVGPVIAVLDGSAVTDPGKIWEADGKGAVLPGLRHIGDLGRHKLPTFVTEANVPTPGTLHYFTGASGQKFPVNPCVELPESIKDKETALLAGWNDADAIVPVQSAPFHVRAVAVGGWQSEGSDISRMILTASAFWKNGRWIESFTNKELPWVQVWTELPRLFAYKHETAEVLASPAQGAA